MDKWPNPLIWEQFKQSGNHKHTYINTFLWWFVSTFKPCALAAADFRDDEEKELQDFLPTPLFLGLMLSKTKG